MSLANNSRDLLRAGRAGARPPRRRHLRPVRGVRQPDPQGAPAGVPAGDAVRGLQAARGAALTRPAPALRRGAPALLGAGRRCSSLALDVATKVLVVAELEGRRTLELLGGQLLIRVSRNPGAAFSFAEGATRAVHRHRGRRSSW